MAATPVQELLDEAACYICFSDGSLTQAIKIALMARTLTALVPTADTTPQALLAYANCYNCFTSASLGDLMEISLLDQISQAV